jgi:hypothetical protein
MEDLEVVGLADAPCDGRIQVAPEVEAVHRSRPTRDEPNVLHVRSTTVGAAGAEGQNLRVPRRASNGPRSQCRAQHSRKRVERSKPEAG